MKTIACYSSKGGVGKTAAAVNLAYAAAAQGHRSLLVDLDQQGAASFYCRVRPTKRLRAKRLLHQPSQAEDAIRETDFPGLFLLPAHLSYRNFDAALDSLSRSKRRLADLLAETGQDFDRVILDSPPSLSRVAENLFRAADIILVPLVPTPLSLRSYEQLNAFFQKSGFKRKKLHPFFSLVDRRKRLHTQTMDTLRSSEKRLLDTAIPYSAEIEAMGVRREPALSYAPTHPSCRAFLELWKEVDAL